MNHPLDKHLLNICCLTSSKTRYRWIDKHNTQNQDAHSLTAETLEPLIPIQYDEHSDRGLEQHVREEFMLQKRRICSSRDH